MQGRLTQRPGGRPGCGLSGFGGHPGARRAPAVDGRGVLSRSPAQEYPRLEEIADKVLFGTDWPGPGVPDVRGNIEKFLALPLPEEARRKILYDNAARLFPSRT